MKQGLKRRLHQSVPTRTDNTKTEQERYNLSLPFDIDELIAEADTITATNAVISFMEKTTSNKSFVLSVKKSFATD